MISVNLSHAVDDGVDLAVAFVASRIGPITSSRSKGMCPFFLKLSLMLPIVKALSCKR